MKINDAGIESAIYSIKAEVGDPGAETFAFSAQKTMYGGKYIAEGDTALQKSAEGIVSA